MIKRLIFVAAGLIALSAMNACSGKATSGNSLGHDSTLCQFSNINKQRMMQYATLDGDTCYINNEFSAFWPELINGKACPALQAALLQVLTDSSELNTLDLAMEYLLKPNQYLEFDSTTLKTVQTIKDDDNNLSTSDVNVTLESMTDRLMTYHIRTYGYLAGGAHGIYSNRYVTYDLLTEKAVPLSDLIADTTLLRNTILKSIKQEYEYDKDDLFIPDNGLLPLPGDFFIEGSVLHAVYQVYDIASYAQGAIVAPIYPYMLKPEEMKRLFTPYGLELIDYNE